MVTARDLVDGSAAILLDFDGPVCSVFAGLPAAKVADHMRAELAYLNRMAGDDPLELLREARGHSPEAGALAERMLAEAELQAVRVAEPTDGAVEFLSAMCRLEKPLAIVSNNGERAIRAYLTQHGLETLVTFIRGRHPSDARLMKPHPWAIGEALDAMRVSPENSLLIGDSVSDIEAAHAIGARILAFANRPGKVSSLQAARPDSLITSMRQLIAPLK